MRTGIILEGQERRRAYAESIFMSERLPPAILLIGPGASGKAALALEFAKRHLCLHPEKGERPCGQCSACREMNFLRHPDFIMFSARDVSAACRAFQAVAVRARLEPFLLEVDLLARRVIQRIRCGFFKLKDVSNKEADVLEERIAALEKLLSDCRAAIFGPASPLAPQPRAHLPAAPASAEAVSAAPLPARPAPPEPEPDLFGFFSDTASAAPLPAASESADLFDFAPAAPLPAAPVPAAPPELPEPEPDLFGFLPETPGAPVAAVPPETGTERYDRAAAREEAPGDAARAHSGVHCIDEDTAADCRARLADALQEIAQLDILVPHTLPIAGIQDIIRILSRRPVLGQHRVVFIEGLEKLRTEGANAFLKTLEEPPPDTLILLTASEPESVLATIRSRSAILSMPRMTDEEVRRVAHEYYGLPSTEFGDVSGRDVYAYLESLGDDAEAVRKDIVRFLDLIRDADRDPSFFDFAKDIEKRKMAPAFCSALIDLITENVVAKETAVGGDRIYATALSHFRPDFLRRVLREVHVLAKGIVTNNFSASQGIVSLVQAFWLEENSAL